MAIIILATCVYCITPEARERTLRSEIRQMEIDLEDARLGHSSAQRRHSDAELALEQRESAARQQEALQLSALEAEFDKMTTAYRALQLRVEECRVMLVGLVAIFTLRTTLSFRTCSCVAIVSPGASTCNVMFCVAQEIYQRRFRVFERREPFESFCVRGAPRA